MDQVITLPTFLDFCTTTGLARIGIVAKAKESTPEKARAYDFYVQVTDALRDMHINGRNPLVLDSFLNAQTDARRRQVYPDLVTAYRKFLGVHNSKVTWWAPPAGTVRLGDLHVHVAPEVGLNLDGLPHLISLDFGKPPARKKRIAMHLDLVFAAFGELLPGATFAMLDVRHGKLHRMKIPHAPRMNLLLRAEAQAFEAIWRSL